MYKRQGERYLVSPWMLMWEDENYYLLAYDHKAEMIKYFRVDKLRQLKREEGKREGETAYQKLEMCIRDRPNPAP